MERIKKALERAKARNTKASQEVYIDLDKGSQEKRGDERKEQQTLENLDYKYTKVVALNNKQLERNRIVAHNKNHLQTLSFDLLRTQVLKKMQDNNWKTLAITSPTPNAGKTVVAINLAMSIAHQTEKSAMLVDFDLKRPKISTYLGLNQQTSLNDVLAGDKEIQDVLINPGVPRLVILPTSKPVVNSAETLSSSKVTDLLDDFKNRYDDRIVIIDLPPLLYADDALSILPHVDCVLMIVGNGMNKKKEIEDSLSHLPSSNLLGVVLNKSNEETKRYYQ